MKFLVSMYNLDTGKRVTIPRVVSADHSGEAIDNFKGYMERMGEKTEGYMIMAEEYKGE